MLIVSPIAIFSRQLIIKNSCYLITNIMDKCIYASLRQFRDLWELWLSVLISSFFFNYKILKQHNIINVFVMRCNIIHSGPFIGTKSPRHKFWKLLNMESIFFLDFWKFILVAKRTSRDLNCGSPLVNNKLNRILKTPLKCQLKRYIFGFLLRVN